MLGVGERGAKSMEDEKGYLWKIGLRYGSREKGIKG